MFNTALDGLLLDFLLSKVKFLQLKKGHLAKGSGKVS
jgi:hypothetical protein